MKHLINVVMCGMVFLAGVILLGITIVCIRTSNGFSWWQYDNFFERLIEMELLGLFIFSIITTSVGFVSMWIHAYRYGKEQQPRQEEIGE